MRKFLINSTSYITILLVLVVALAFTSGAAMGLDIAVTNKSFGLSMFIIGILLTFIWIVDNIVKAFVKSYKEMRGEENIKMIANLVYGSIAILVIIMDIVALIIH